MLLHQLSHFFQKSGVYGSFSVIDEFDLSLIPFDNDIMSLEQEKAFYVSTVCVKIQ